MNQHLKTSEYYRISEVINNNSEIQNLKNNFQL